MSPGTRRTIVQDSGRQWTGAVISQPTIRKSDRLPEPGAALQRGWVMLAVLFALALLGATMAGVGTVWSTAVKRDKEAELLYAGDQYARAIASYYRRSPGAAKLYPKDFKDLLEDPRFPNPVRHLRRLYADPVTGHDEWGLLKDENGGIQGVYSLSEEAPLKVAGFPQAYAGFSEATRYRDWVFKARVDEAEAAKGGSTFVQRPEVAGPGGGAPVDTGKGAPPPLPAADPTRNRQLLKACEETRQREMQSCESLRAPGDEAGYMQCMKEVSEQFQQCLRQRYAPES